MPELVTQPAELEIGLHRLRADAYQVELRFNNPASEAEVNPVKGDVRFDMAALLALELNPRDYGKALASMLFEDDNIRSMYGQVRSSVDSLNLPLRVRLLVGPTAPELHSLRWELLTDPAGESYLFTSERILFSRFMTSSDWRTIRLRPKSDMNAVVAVSAPSNLDRYQLAQVDIDGETARARENLSGIDVAAAVRPVTLARLIDRLREPVDILYLVCHGALANDGPHLFLEADDGTVAIVKGQDFADRLSELPQQPRLVVLASCESAGSAALQGVAGSDALDSLAPMLAKAGVAAVVAMRGKISMETIKKTLPVFFRELLRDGQIDRAMAAARSAAVAGNRPDFWMPALYLRLRSGRIWYEPGFGKGDDFEKWQSIVSHVRDGKFVAITGSGVAESIWGDSRNLARELAQAHGFPLASYQRDDLPEVMQYLSVSQDPTYAVQAVVAQLRSEVLRRQGARLPAELLQAPLPKILDVVMETPREGQPKNPYQILAGLPGSVYICATRDTLMTRALKQAGKSPQVLYPSWRRTGENIPAEPIYEGTPSPATPVVYQLLGVFGKDESLVLTEDDYFDYMIATVTYKLVPRVVRSALVSNSLLFLGFHLTDWSFQVLFRLIQSLEGGSRRAKMAHVGVQINPDEYTTADVDKARRYLQKYFDQEANIALFWGSAEDFLNQLQKQLETLPKQAAMAAAAGGGDWDV